MNYNPIPYRRLGTMIDCSRNAVMKVETLKKWIDITSDLGFNCVMLYMEDTYTVKEYEYFGYMRGRYSKEELKEIDEYGQKYGVEVIPCIQTLAHLERLMRWRCYQRIRDCGDILLAGEERTYQLIENMFKTIAECFTTRTMNIGMDEAWLLGRGTYFDKHGAQNRVDILMDHLLKVSEIAKKYGCELQT